MYTVHLEAKAFLSHFISHEGRKIVFEVSDPLKITKYDQIQDNSIIQHSDATCTKMVFVFFREKQQILTMVRLGG